MTLPVPVPDPAVPVPLDESRIPDACRSALVALVGCEGCDAVPGEPCGPGCLSWVT